MPANVVNARQTSETFRVYDPNDALGDVHPNQPRANDPQIAQPAPKKNKGCGGAGQILLAVVAIAVAAVVAQWAIPHLAKTAIGQAIGGALGAAGSTIGTGVAAGAAGSLVSQGVGVAVGLQDRIDWRGVALSAIAGGVSAGIGPSPSGSFVAEGVRGAAANALTQGIAIATGLQSKFDWTGVAVGAVVRGSRNAISNVATGDSWSADLVNQATRGVVAGAAGAGVRSLIDGTSFERSFRAALPDIIGSTIGSAITRGIQTRQQAAQDRATTARHAEGDYLTESLAGAVDRITQSEGSASSRLKQSTADMLSQLDDTMTRLSSTIAGGAAGTSGNWPADGGGEVAHVPRGEVDYLTPAPRPVPVEVTMLAPLGSQMFGNRMVKIVENTDTTLGYRLVTADGGLGEYRTMDKGVVHEAMAPWDVVGPGEVATLAAGLGKVAMGSFVRRGAPGVVIDGAEGASGRAFTNLFPEHQIGAPIQTFSPQQLQNMAGRRLNYVVTEDGALVIGRQAIEVGGGHIDIAAGKPVLAAGEVKVVSGQIRMIDN